MEHTCILKWWHLQYSAHTYQETGMCKELHQKLCGVSEHAPTHEACSRKFPQGLTVLLPSSLMKEEQLPLLWIRQKVPFPLDVTSDSDHIAQPKVEDHRLCI